MVVECLLDDVDTQDWLKNYDDSYENIYRIQVKHDKFLMAIMGSTDNVINSKGILADIGPICEIITAQDFFG